MKIIGVIPARMGSSRFPNKPLALIHGMPMVEHCFHRTRMALGDDAVYVATCDKVIADHIEAIGGKAVMTSKMHSRATTRTAEAMDIIETAQKQFFDIVVMVQGDEPLIDPEVIAEMIKAFEDDAVEIVNVMSRLHSYDQFIDKNNVKVVVNKDSNALYFSREPIPSPWHGLAGLPMYMQTGVIAFRRGTLLEYNQMPETQLEQIESIDMNRVLENGGSIRMLLTESKTIGVDTAQELQDAAVFLKSDPVMLRYLTG